MRKTIAMLAAAMLPLLSGLSAEPAAIDLKQPARPLVQIAVLLDTSGSMEGMLKQAQTQLWAIVNEFATAQRDGAKPILQVALYHYGTPSLGSDNGYIRQLLPLTDDLDKVSEELFKLRSSGGDEYCGWAIKSAVEQLKWSSDPKDYKAIFIAGNESFAQGPVDFREACRAAIAKGVIVNAIHCAGASDEFWKDAPALADGQFMRIDGNKAVVEVKAPQDAELAKLNEELNKTYIAYGRAGAENAQRQAAVDAKAKEISSSNIAARAVAKSSAQYRNASWDLLDAVQEGGAKLESVKDEDLPEPMRKMSLEERKSYLEAKAQERAGIQAKVQALAKERDAFVATEMKKSSANSDTLGEQMKASVKAQAAKIGFSFDGK